ncbi:MAG: isochorismate synthase [Bacillales bacterium]|jgi:menaquinone-specific isochorismate synthase|nr:isochorismate synthase [Bacillales bacterium]
MTINVDIDLKDSVIRARNNATESNQTVVFCHVKKIEKVSILNIYKNSERKYKGKRFYWENLEQNLKFVGIDTAFKLQMKETETNRFDVVEKFWDDFSELMVITGVQNIIGTGPICYGAFSFKPELTDLIWDEFGALLFYIPRHLISNVDGACYLSSTLIVNADTTDEEIDLFEAEFTQILQLDSEINVQYKSFSIAETSIHEWTDMVEDVLSVIRSGELEKVVLARSTELIFNHEISSSTVMENLSLQQNNSYLFALENEHSTFLGASPERLILKQGQNISTACVAGTTSRGETEELDQKLEFELINDEKNINEHNFVVDYIRSILEKKCIQLEIPSKPQILKNKSVQHLYTPVFGQAFVGDSILNFAKDLHPTPAMGGIPLNTALQKIDELENIDRGFYASPIGWMDSQGNGEFIVGIRSALLNRNKAILFSGCGIVGDSDPIKEYEETAMKFKPMLSALGII